MTSITTEQTTPSTDDSQEKARQRRYQRRRRAQRSMISHYLENIMRSPQLFHIGLGVLLVTGFIHVSIINNVFGPKPAVSYSMNTDSMNTDFNSGLNSINSDVLTISDTSTTTLTSFYRDPSNEFVEVAPTSSEQAVSVTPLASKWLNDDLTSLNLIPVKVKEVDTEQVDQLTNPDSTTTLASVTAEPSTYVVNEGSSLWRTGKQFLDDDGLLDTLIDDLAQNGMNVRSVRPGVAFIVNDMGSEGMHVVVNDRGDMYQSHIVNGKVSTSVLSVR